MSILKPTYYEVLQGDCIEHLNRGTVSNGLCPNSPVKTPGLDTSDGKHSTLQSALLQPFDSAHQKPLVSIVLFQTRCQGAS